MRVFLSFLSICVLSFAIGCSHQELYEAVQDNRQFECEKLSHPQYEECMDENNESYEDYERKRKELEQ